MRQNLRHWTDVEIRNLPLPSVGSKKLFDPSLPGFGLRLTARSRTFIVQHGKERSVTTIGKYPEISLREARKLAIGVLSHPTPKKRATSRTELQTAFLEHCQATLRPSTVRRYILCLSKREPDTSHDVAAFKAMYNWGQRIGLTDTNPYQHRQATYGSRDRVLTDDEIARIWQHERPPFSNIIKLLLLTGQRRGQFQSFNQQWVQGDELHFPASIMKSKRPHIIPLSTWSKQYVSDITQFNGWGKSKARLDQESGVSDWVIHDLRRYFSSTMARLGVALHITEHLLDHRSSTSGVQAVYMRYGFLPEMRQALALYEQHIQTVTA